MSVSGQIVCPHCSGIKRVPLDRPARAVRCGRCKDGCSPVARLMPVPRRSSDRRNMATCRFWSMSGLHMAIVSRRIVGWATSDRLKTNLALNALPRAIALRQLQKWPLADTLMASPIPAGDAPNLDINRGIMRGHNGRYRVKASPIKPGKSTFPRHEKL